MTPIDNIYTLKHYQEYNNEQILNIYTYLGDVGQTAVNLVAAFQEDVLPQIRAIQASQIITTRFVAQSLGNLGDNSDVDVFLGGFVTPVSILPVFNAIGFTLRPASRVVRPGSKRIAGIYEEALANGVITNADALVALENIRLALDSDISDLDVLFFEPIIVKRVVYDVPGSDPVRQAHRYPETDEELVYSLLSGVKTSPRITHQTSRGN